jgi:bifunctional ADP-heptose synthase (sugar kinase/adenylyltransferase)
MRILVIGESATDIFQYGQTLRVSPESACLVFTPTYKTENDGMAANVVANLRSLDANLDITFVTNMSKIFKIRYVEQKSNHHIMRQDINDHVGEKYRHVDYDDFSVVVVSD